MWRKIWPLLLLLYAMSGRAQTVSFTFDDGLDPRTEPQAAVWNQRILDGLAKAGVKAMVLPACSRIESTEGMELVRAWGRAGHSIANHTYSHRNLSSSTVSAEAFIADVEKCDRMLRSMDGWTPRLRFPYLKEGDSVEERDAVRRWMGQSGYRAAPVSIDASDWYYSQRFVSWRKQHPDADPTRYREAYLAR